MSTKKQFPEGMLGKKLGMTQVFTEDGKCVPVTVIQAGPNYVLEVRNSDKHGYSSVQLGFEPKKQQRVDKAQMGHFSKAGAGTFYHIREMRCDVDALGWGEVGKEIKVSDVFKEGEKVDVSGTSIGRGFAGVVKRFKVGGQPASRGTHEMFRHIGSVGNRKTPGRIFKNKRMPGHLGNKKVTTINLEVVGVRPEDNVILVKGAVPGSKGSLVMIKKAIKAYTPTVKSEKAAA